MMGDCSVLSLEKKFHQTWWAGFKRHFNISVKLNHRDRTRAKLTLNPGTVNTEYCFYRYNYVLCIKVPLKTSLSMADRISFVNVLKLSTSNHRSKLSFLPVENEFHRPDNQ